MRSSILIGEVHKIFLLKQGCKVQTLLVKNDVNEFIGLLLFRNQKCAQSTHCMTVSYFKNSKILTCLSVHLQRVPPLRINDLIHDLRDGTKLLALLEVLSGEKLVS